MLLDPIEREHIIQAARDIDEQGVPIDNQWAEYWIVVSDKEYQFKHLIRKAYEIATGSKIPEEKFTSSPFTRGYIERTFKYKIFFKVPENVQFFNKEEIEFFNRKGGRKYSSTKKSDEVAGRKIKSTIFNKTNVWVRLIDLPDYEVILDNRWQLSGYFKPYSWARIYKKQFKSSQVFFTFGVSSEWKSLVYKIDCQRRAFQKEKALSDAQIEEFDRIVNGTGAEWNEISSEELISYDWEKLKRLTLEFIGYYDALYSEASEAVIAAMSSGSGKSLLDLDKESGLDEVPAPQQAYDALPQKEYNFRGVVIDYEANQVLFSEIGSDGEDLVIQTERRQLEAAGRADLAIKVDKVKDGMGYDIISYDENGVEKYIEVKTTTGKILRPFFMTDNEWEFMKRHSANYCLYRVFDFDKRRSKGKFYRISGDLESQVFFRSKQIEIYPKSYNE